MAGNLGQDQFWNVKIPRLNQEYVQKKSDEELTSVILNGRGKMPAAVMAAAFQDIRKALQIGIDVGMGVGERMAHPGLRGEMDDVGKLLRRKQCGCGGTIGQIELDGPKSGRAVKLLQPRLFESRIVVRRQIVHAHDPAPYLEQAAGHM